MFIHLIIILFVVATGCNVSGLRSFSGRRAAEYENEICEPHKKHLDLRGCGECICKSTGYGSYCEKAECAKTYKRPISARECSPYQDFSTLCHYCKCTSGGIPTGCREKRLGCMDQLIEDMHLDRLHKRVKRFI